jgi:hypothetical protein
MLRRVFDKFLALGTGVLVGFTINEMIVRECVTNHHIKALDEFASVEARLQLLEKNK